MQDTLIEAFVYGVVVDSTNNSTIVLLADVEKTRVLPIWIGPFEALSISQMLEKRKPPSPITHDLIVNIFEESKTTLRQLVIHSVKDGTFYAYLVLELHDERIVRVDTRPSDGIAVALRTSSPIYLTGEVFAIATDYEGLFDQNTTPESINKDFNSIEVKEWIQKLKPSDF